MDNTKKQEFQRRISQANTTDMVVVIYDITLEYLDELKAADGADRRGLSVKVRNCINELIGSLHFDYSPAGELLSLYVYCSRRLTDIQTKNDLGAVDEITGILTRLRDAYAEIAPTNASGPVMSNSEDVYAGLTYGRGVLNEDVLGGGNRGFLV